MACPSDGWEASVPLHMMRMERTNVASNKHHLPLQNATRKKLRMSHFIGLFEYPHNMSVSRERATQKPFYDPASEVMSHHFPFILFVRRSVSLAHIQKESNQSPPFEGKRDKEFADMF